MAITALVGPNGAGKSTFLHALLLFQGRRSAGIEDYYSRDTGNGIKIKITFAGLSDSAKDLLSKYVRDGELDVVRTIHWEDGRATSTLHGYSPRNLDFGGVLGAPNATVGAEHYAHLLANPD